MSSINLTIIRRQLEWIRKLKGCILPTSWNVWHTTMVLGSLQKHKCAFTRHFANLVLYFNTCTYDIFTIQPGSYNSNQLLVISTTQRRVFHGLLAVGAWQRYWWWPSFNFSVWHFFFSIKSMYNEQDWVFFTVTVSAMNLNFIKYIFLHNFAIEIWCLAHQMCMQPKRRHQHQ